MSRVDTNASVDLLLNATQSSSHFNVNNSAGFSSEYAKILKQQIQQLEDVAQENAENLSADSQPAEITTVKRFRPDGSIVINTYEDGKLESQTKIKPHLVPVPDYSAPITPEGHIDTKLVPRLSLMDLLMM